MGRRRPAVGGQDHPAGRSSPRTLITGSGGLSEPRLPDIEGLETFQGELFHSRLLGPLVDLTGKRVAVIGTGASAIQIVPEIQPDVAHLDVYQRTAPYVVPRLDRRYSRLERLALKHVPGVQKAYRSGVYLSREMLVPGFTVSPRLAAPSRALAKANIARGIDDPELRDKVQPTYEIGCKRILISNTYYPALAADNVDLVTDRITKVTGDAVVTADGVERPIDVLIVATGFHTTEQPIAEHIRGRGGRTLAEVWAQRGMASYKGTTTRGFPNLFQIVGRQHRPGALLDGVHHREPDRLRRRRPPHDALTRPRRGRAPAGRAGRLEHRHAAPPRPHRVEHRRLLELVPRRARQQHHPLAACHVHLPQAAVPLRRRGVRRRARPQRPASATDQPSTTDQQGALA